VESLAGKTLGHYRVERLLANGGQADVYQARDERLERAIALKVSAQPTALAHFRAGAILTSSLDHPNILPIYDFGAQEGIAYLVRHYATGGSLEDRLRAANGKNGLPLEEVAYYLDQLAAALDYTHTKGISHGNLKPANLLLRERWLMLGDFAAGQRDRPTGQAEDMYALGVTLHRLLWGSVPPQRPTSAATGTARHSVKSSPPLSGLTAHQTQAIEALVDKAMAPRPANRPPTAGGLAAEFHAILAAPGAPGTAIPTEIPLICPTCGFLNKPQARFCRNDGTRLPVICPRCGAENRFDAKFCQSDGTELVRICPTCGALNPRQASRCQNDHTPLVRLCPTCGFENALRARFCERDGAQLA
jgi:serine/threonine protein kinase